MMELLSIKLHFFFFNSGTAPLVPYLSSYARQLGFSPSTVGLIYTLLPIFGLFAKPLFGILADKYRAQKSIFLTFQLVTILSFSAIYFVPQKVPELHHIPVEMDCGDGAAVLQACYPPEADIDQCKINHVADMNNTLCKMTCNMTSSDTWKNVCDQWHFPTSCTKRVNTEEYTALISNVSFTDDCVFIETRNVDFGDGQIYESSCESEDLGEFCDIECSNPTLSALTSGNEVNLTCVENILNYQVCNNRSTLLIDAFDTKDQLGQCKVNCHVNKSVLIMDLCEMWNPGALNVCRNEDNSVPTQLDFQASMDLSRVIVDHNCVFIDMLYIKMNNGTIHYPSCGPDVYHERWPNAFVPQCNIDCGDIVVNQLLKSATENTTKGSEYDFKFWMFFGCMIVSWIGQAVVVTFADAICFNILGVQMSLYGKQRMWGSFGWGIFSLLTGILIDVTSEGTYKNYTIAFVLMIVFMSCDMIASCFVKVESTEMSMNMMADIGSMLSCYATVLFLFWTVAVGLCTGLVWQFLFWHIEDVINLACEGTEYVKTLQGLVSAIQTFGGEIPFMFLSGYILKKFGHNHVMSAVLFGFGIRFLLYSHLVSAWWILPIELFQGLTSGMFYPTMTSYANIVSPSGTETTVQGLVGAIFEGVGSSLGSYIGGRLYQAYGGWVTFRIFGIGALVACVIHAVAIVYIKKETRRGMTSELNTVVQYTANDEDANVRILNDVIEVY